MAIEVGNIFEGKVTGIKPFGAFVALPEGKSGMVHISEVSNEFVQDINTALQEGQTVNVKVINVAPDGKIALSIKQLLPRAPRPQAPRGPRPQGDRPYNGGNRQGGPGGGHSGGGRMGGKRGPRNEAPRVWQPRQSAQPDSMNFEDMMNRFKSQSEEKLGDLDRETAGRRGGGYAPRSRRR